jgi:hypothetical protein
MPRGTRHEESGQLLREGGWLVLLRHDGGRWRLDVGRKAARLLGQWVHVDGIRSDFDILDVQSINRH